MWGTEDKINPQDYPLWVFAGSQEICRGALRPKTQDPRPKTRPGSSRFRYHRQWVAGRSLSYRALSMRTHCRTCQEMAPGRKLGSHSSLEFCNFMHSGCVTHRGRPSIPAWDFACMTGSKFASGSWWMIQSGMVKSMSWEIEDALINGTRAKYWSLPALWSCMRDRPGSQWGQTEQSKNSVFVCLYTPGRQCCRKEYRSYR